MRADAFDVLWVADLAPGVDDDSVLALAIAGGLILIADHLPELRGAFSVLSPGLIRIRRSLQ